MKKVLLVLIGVTSVVFLVFGYMIVLDIKNQEEAKTDGKEEAEYDETTQLQESRNEIKGSISDSDIKEYKEKGLNPFGEKATMNELTEDRYNEYIHGMSHQKVQATKKWGFYGIHPVRINWLLDGLDNVNLNYEDLYRGILERWKSGNFSSVDDDHNSIWNIQGGTVGKATGVLSPGEEQEYIEKH